MDVPSMNTLQINENIYEKLLSKKGTTGKTAYRTPSRRLAVQSTFHPQSHGVRFGKRNHHTRLDRAIVIVYLLNHPTDNRRPEIFDGLNFLSRVKLSPGWRAVEVFSVCVATHSFYLPKSYSMARSKTSKQDILKILDDKIKTSTSVVFANLGGLKVSQADAVRKGARKEQVSVTMAKRPF